MSYTCNNAIASDIHNLSMIHINRPVYTLWLTDYKCKKRLQNYTVVSQKLINYFVNFYILFYVCTRIPIICIPNIFY